MPRRPSAAGGHPHAEDLSVPIAVDPGRDQHHGVDDTATLADLHRQRVSDDERERPCGVQRPVTALPDVLVELGSHP